MKRKPDEASRQKTLPGVGGILPSGKEGKFVAAGVYSYGIRPRQKIRLTKHHGKRPRPVLEGFCRQARKANFLLREYTLMVFDQGKKFA